MRERHRGKDDELSSSPWSTDESPRHRPADRAPFVLAIAALSRRHGANRRE